VIWDFISWSWLSLAFSSRKFAIVICGALTNKSILSRIGPEIRLKYFCFWFSVHLHRFFWPWA